MNETELRNAIFDAYGMSPLQGEGGVAASIDLMNAIDQVKWQQLRNSSPQSSEERLADILLKVGVVK